VGARHSKPPKKGISMGKSEGKSEGTAVLAGVFCAGCSSSRLRATRVDAHVHGTLAKVTRGGTKVHVTDVEDCGAAIYFDCNYCKTITAIVIERDGVTGEFLVTRLLDGEQRTPRAAT
jgi:hypothetical protein